MSVNTHGKLVGRICHEEVLNFIREKIDNNAISRVSKSTAGKLSEYDWIKEVYGDSETWDTYSGFISFEYNGNNRNLFYMYSNINSYENLEYYAPLGLSDMVKSETTYLSLGQDDDAVEIIKMIVGHFGGWIDENDCDNEPYYPVLKDECDNIKPVIKVSMKDIYDKFGGVVIIVDRS